MNRTKTYTLCLTALFTALICVLAQVQIPLGPVPFTMAMFAFFLTGAMLPPVWALAAGVAYLLLGCAGLPVFTGFSGGVGILLGPTGGYILGYPLMAMIAAFGVFRRGFVWQVVGMVLGMAVCYAVGTAWFMVQSGSGLAQSLTLCVIPFVLPDLVKAVLATALARTLRRRAPALFNI